MRERDGRRRVVIEGVKPEIDAGCFPVKRTVGERVVVEADIFVDGHDAVAARLLHRPASEQEWTETVMEPLVNDRWRAQFSIDRQEPYVYTIEGWVDHFGSWRRDLRKKVDAEQDVSVDLLIGAQLISEAAKRAPANDRSLLEAGAESLRRKGDLAERSRLALDDALADLVERYPDRRFATRYGRELQVVVDRERARFSTWYELFPRSASPELNRPGTLEDVARRLPYIAEMGFDVLYLPPVHPIGETHRKGKNNVTVAQPDDPGSPWAIGGKRGGHKAVHPELGTLDDVRRLVDRAKEYGIEIALDVAFQAAPDHPYVREHPEWFKSRPDGTLQYAENPPKKYEDIYPFYFETDAWKDLWHELKSVFDHWIDQGIRIFRVDNPHTKPFPFWEWAIGELKREHPDLIFLAEAFTRPKVMYRLAKLGFTQSYTYFAWRTTKWELTQYFTELTQTEVGDFFRPNLWPNTPDILTEQLQFGQRAAFVTRLVLAATLGANYGMYGPPFELMEHVAREPGSEEYLHSEKYEVRHWDLDRRDSLRGLIAKVNRARRENEALQTDRTLRFHNTDNEEIICYSKTDLHGENVVVVVVNLDSHYKQSGWVELPLDELGIDHEHPYQMHDLVTDERYLWHGSHNYVELDPYGLPAHIFRVRRRVKTEREFEQYT